MRHLPRATRRLVAASARRLLAELDGARDVSFVRLRGNRGDELIWAGARQLLRGHDVREVDPERLSLASGDLALVSGCGGWCPDFHGYAPQVLVEATQRFDRVVLLPSTFVPTHPLVHEVLTTTPARLYARDATSQRLVAEIARHPVGLAHDTAFFFDYSPYLVPGRGVLHAMRTDHASTTDLTAIGIDPATNDDVSRSCRTMDEWLWRLARVAEIHTDRAHVMIAGAMLGKRVTWYGTTDHKVPGIATHATAGLDLRPGPDLT